MWLSINHWLRGGNVYVIIVYDIAVERVNKVRKYLRQYLMWRQNSVFEGELSDSQFMRVKNTLHDMINDSEDHIIFYILRDKKYVREEELGTSKVELGYII